MTASTTQCTLVLLGMFWLPLAAHADRPSAQKASTRSPHGSLSMPCENCHTFTSWKPIRNIPEFDHNKTRYPLRGLHEGVTCRQCHTSLVFTNVGTKCADCHADIHRGQFGAKCDQCHSVGGWRVSLQSVKQHQNRFPLSGAHAMAQCESCHTSAAVGRFTGLSTQCYSCHNTAFAQAKMPDHQGAGLPTTCEMCHSMDAWPGARFDHARFTGFALTGMHATLDCVACHTGGSYKGTSANCFSCHRADFEKTSNPNHVQAGFPQDCSRCHNTTTWAGAQFDHNTFTSFPLTGAHVNVACAQCHTNGRFAGTPKDCTSCHLADYQKTTNPNHVAAGFSQNCGTCHTTAQWSGASFDHSLTRFPLTGAHAQQQCTACHGSQYTVLDTACVSCHLTNFNSAKNPDHVAAGLPQQCQVCHSTSAWTPATFDHSRTNFPLTGAHVSVQCANCHVGGRYTGTPKDCASCHLADYQRTTNPNHAAAGFPQSCGTCHTTVTWSGAQFDHNTLTSFPLTGAHVNVACAQCHTNGRFAGTPKDCASCHLTDFQNAKNPDHVAAGFPQDCSICHSTAQWQGAKFNHALTKFPLTGAHAQQECTACHIGGKYTALDTACVSCHLTNFNNTTNPNHTAAGFPQQCEVCHSASAWTPASFDHSKTNFPLTGAHTTVACANCHVGGRYAGTPTDCYSCHKTEFTTVTNPNHVAAGFPTNCALCHTTTTWTGAKFNHTQFPIYSGAHAGKWTTCNDCHVNPSNYQAFSCLTCHEHSKTTMDDKHKEVSGYVYNSANCYSCHPNGKAN